MKTTFSLRIGCEDRSLALAAASECIDQIDQIENKLSRYLPGSDIWQINHLNAGESLFVSELTYECLRLALEVYQETQGLFDITLGQQIEHRKNEQGGPLPALSGQLMIDPDRPRVHCVEAGRQIDLGGIGKGFALDHLMKILRDGGISSALLAAGASTQLAHGATPWPIQLTGQTGTTTIDLVNQSLSASGTAIQGSHIISPYDQESAYPRENIWLVHDSAAKADAYTTAALLMPDDMLAEFAESVAAIYLETTDGITTLRS
ncbi:MAG: FAD:protein FMN transferase [Verrucomicrobiota bacterium]